MDPDLIQTATDVIQAQERFQIQLRQRRDQDDVIKKAFTESYKVLDQLRDIKSDLEKTSVTFELVKVCDDALAEIRSLVLMHVPGTLTDDTKKRLNVLTTEAFKGSCREVLFGAMVTCPWYWATQEERGQQAKHNGVFVVYVNKDEQFLSPVNPHQKEKDSEVIDKGWFYAAEVYHFSHYLLKGKARFVETMFLPDSAVFCSNELWNNLRENLSVQCLGLRGFLEQCRGQAVGTVGKKNKATGRMRLKDGATLHEFCDSFRLLHHASQAMTKDSIHLDRLQELSLPDDTASEALATLRQSYQADTCDRQRLFDVLMSWRQQIDKTMAGRKFTPPAVVEKTLASWLFEIRTRHVDNLRPLRVDPDKRESLLDLMAKIGGPVVKMDPENILLVVQAGSILYGLNTPQSDVDYLVIYADPVQKVLSSCTRNTESFESRGPDKSFEYGAYEVRLFCEMLWKGSVVILELLFADSVEYSSESWESLLAHKHLFLTERAILQYFGLIKNNLSDLEHKRYIDTPARERKLFYQILHKLYCLEFFLRDECPVLKCDGETRDYIMRVRRGPLEGDLSRETLYESCVEKMHDLRRRLSDRTRRLPENAKFSFLAKWLMAVRGWDVTQENSEQTDNTDVKPSS